jgi:hypothetical protein
MADVHWNSYAHVYDLMAENNPGYQDILKRFKAENQPYATWVQVRVIFRLH